MSELHNCYDDPYTVDWQFIHCSRALAGGEARDRYDLSPEKIELIEGRIFCSDEERLHMVGFLIENVGLDAVVRLGSPHAWRQAIEAMERGEPPAGTGTVPPPGWPRLPTNPFS